jgi:phospholipase C
MASLQKIDHIVVLMLENRSFDSLLGTLYPKSDSFEGLNGTEQNPDANGTPVVVWNSPGTDETTMRIPNPDPGELWTDSTCNCSATPRLRRVRDPPWSALSKIISPNSN